MAATSASAGNKLEIIDKSSNNIGNKIEIINKSSDSIGNKNEVIGIIKTTKLTMNMSLIMRRQKKEPHYIVLSNFGSKNDMDNIRIEQNNHKPEIVTPTNYNNLGTRINNGSND